MYLAHRHLVKTVELHITIPTYWYAVSDTIVASAMTAYDALAGAVIVTLPSTLASLVVTLNRVPPHGPLAFVPEEASEVTKPKAFPIVVLSGEILATNEMLPKSRPRYWY